MAQVLAAPITAGSEQTSSGIVCCPGQLCASVLPAQLPWAKLVVGIFVAAQTMTLGMTINLTAPDDPRTLLALQGGMAAATSVVVILLGWPLARQALGLLRQRRLSMELFFVVGIAASLAISVWSMVKREGPVYFEVVNVLLVVYSLGNAITSHSRTRALAATEVMLAGVAEARLVNGEKVEVTRLGLGDHVKVVPGELIPVDGVVVEGQSLVRTTAFTGEWQSSRKGPGETVLAGSACEDGTLVIESTSAGLDRRIDRLANLITSACQTTSPMQRMADRFVRVFLPIVLAVSVATLLYWGLGHSWTAGLFNALAVILVACPCAAGMAVPLATWTAIGRLAGKGVLLRSADALERLASVEGVVFDKTGTLSDEALELKSIQTAPDPQQRARALALISAVESHSDHPVALALRSARAGSSGASRVILEPPIAVHAVRTLPGQGIGASVELDGRPRDLLLIRRASADELMIDATLEGTWIATATFTEALRASANGAIRKLCDMGLPVRIMTGDLSGREATSLAPITARMTPEDKHDLARKPGLRELFVGDGINDAAAMAASHASMAMASGAAITVEAADATLHGGDLTKIADSILLARSVMATIRSNFAWAVAYNVVGMALAASGLLHPVIAAILMSVSSGVVAWRSFRLVGRPPKLEHLLRRCGTSENNEFLEPRVPQQNERSSAGPNPARSIREASPSGNVLYYGGMHAEALIGQGLILTALAQLGWAGSSVTVVIGGVAALAIVRYADRLPAWVDMTIGMVSLGGLGMNLGWWMDLNFDPAVRNGTVLACCMIDKTLDAASLQANSHWMYWLMLLLGVPAMYLLRRGPICFSWRQWCCSGMLLLGVPGMCFGMWAGTQLASHLETFSGQTQVVLSYLLMMAGMVAGMLVPHGLELALRPKP